MKLPYVNTRAPLSESDFEFFQSTMSDEVQTRTRLLSDYGIVSGISTDDENSPLYVKEITGGVSISKGAIITPQGNYIESNDNIIFESKLFNENQEYFIFAEYSLVGANKTISNYDTFECKFQKRADKVDKRVNAAQYSVDANVCENDYNSQANKIIKYSKSEDLLDHKIFDKDRIQNIVILSYVVNDQDNLKITLSIDGRKDLRPWFSSKDISHRMKVGSGDSTDNNPHGLALEDLTAGDLSLYEMLQTNGCIIAKDKDFTTIPGRKVVFDYAIADINKPIEFSTDENNENKNPKSTKPFMILNVVETEGFNKYAFNYNFEEGLLRIFGLEEPKRLTITAFVVDACTPYINGDSVDFLQPSLKEIIISDGITLKELSNNSINVIGNIIPKTFYLYLTKDGTFLANPKPHGTFPIYNIDVSKENIINLTDEREFQIELIFNDALDIDVEITLSGTDNNGNPQDETVRTRYDTSPLGSNEAYYFKSTYVWKEVKSWTIDSITYMPPETEMTLYEKYTNKETNPMMLVSKIEHDRQFGITKVYDLRDIKPGLNNYPPINVDFATVAIEKGKLLKYVDIDSKKVVSVSAQNFFEHSIGGLYDSVMIPVNANYTQHFGYSELSIYLAIEVGEDNTKYNNIEDNVLLTAYKNASTPYFDSELSLKDTKLIGDKLILKYTFEDNVNVIYVYGITLSIDGGFKNYGISIKSGFNILSAPQP